MRSGIYNIIFYIELFSLFLFINSFSFYVLENAIEKQDSSKTNILSFTIKGGIDNGYNEDKYFKIQTEIYKDNEYLIKKIADCTLPRYPNAEFGASTNANCELDLSSSPNANKIKFIEFNSNENDVKINDLKKYVLEQNLSFTKKAEIKTDKPDIEFVASNIKSIKCVENKFIFGIEGEINKYWIDKFNFEITLNPNSNPITAKCECPNVYFNSDVTINCTITIQNDYNYINSLRNGIEIKENFYNTINTKSEKKILKIKIKNNQEKIEFRDIRCNPNTNEQNDRDRNNKQDYNQQNNRGYPYENNYQNSFSKNNDYKENENRWEKEREAENRRRREREEKEREEEKKKRDQDDLAQFLRKRQQEKEEKEKENRNRYNDNDYSRRSSYDNNDNNYGQNYNQRNNYNDNDDIIDYNSNVKLIHVQVRYSYGFIYYMFYALSPVPIGHKIKARFSITKYNYNSGYNEVDNKYIILKAEDEINTNDKNIIIEYVAKFECQECKKIVLDRNNIQGAKIFNIPEDAYYLDAITTNQNNYLKKNSMTSPPLFITENIYNQNCLVILNGNFFNKNKFFASKFALKLVGIGGGYYGNNRNVTVYCGLNDRGIFACPINENLMGFEYKLEQFVIDQKENIIIDNSYVVRDSFTNRVNCAGPNGPQINIGSHDLSMNNKDKDKTNEENARHKTFTWKRILFGIIIIGVLYYVISKCFCQKEEEYPEEYNSRWRVSSSSYGGETYGLRNRW